ncbi:MAG: lasso RiPP family leader peptide-containing protein [Salinisphaera sp.]|nr:lasso RiPP family leader peptide-containing protein [Salinisphaera sp.]
MKLDREPARATRKTYRKPELTHLGEIRELTRGPGTGAGDQLLQNTA